MAEREIFRLIVRAVGMISIGLGLPDLAESALSNFGLPLRPGVTALQVKGPDSPTCCQDSSFYSRRR